MLINWTLYIFHSVNHYMFLKNDCHIIYPVLTYENVLPIVVYVRPSHTKTENYFREL